MRAPLSFAERPLGFSSLSLAWGVRTFFCIAVHPELTFSLGTSLFTSKPEFFPICLIFCLILRLNFSEWSIPWRNRLMIRSSNEWKESATSRPPGLRNFSATFNPARSSCNSLFTNMRNAWKVFVARCVGLWSKSLRAYKAASGKAPVFLEKKRCTSFVSAIN